MGQTDAHHAAGVGRPITLVAVDLDGDGLDDIASANYGDDTVTVLIAQ